MIDETPDHRVETHRVHYDPATSATPTEKLVTAVADLEDVAAIELDPLYETIDPDSLDAFVEAGGTTDFGGHVSFEYEGYEVVVHASGLLELRTAD